MSARRKVATLARQLFKLSFDGDVVSSERVAGVLAWVEKHRPPDATAVLRAYKRLIEAEIARHQAVIEFAGDLQPGALQQIAAAMSQRYGRRIEAVPAANADLIAGVRVRVGCDIFENSVASLLAGLSQHA